MCVNPAEAPDGFSSQRWGLVYSSCSYRCAEDDNKDKGLQKHTPDTTCSALPLPSPQSKDVFLSRYPRIAALLVTHVQNNCNSCRTSLQATAQVPGSTGSSQPPLQTSASQCHSWMDRTTGRSRKDSLSLELYLIYNLKSQGPSSCIMQWDAAKLCLLH